MKDKAINVRPERKAELQMGHRTVRLLLLRQIRIHSSRHLPTLSDRFRQTRNTRLNNPISFTVEIGKTIKGIWKVRIVIKADLPINFRNLNNIEAKFSDAMYRSK